MVTQEDISIVVEADILMLGLHHELSAPSFFATPAYMSSGPGVSASFFGMIVRWPAS